MSKRLLLAALAVTVSIASGCDQLTGLGEDAELLGLSCSENDTTLIGVWSAETYDWGEGDMIARGWSLEIELLEDGDGRLAETRPVESDSVPTSGTPEPAGVGARTAATSHTMTDSAHFKWAGCDGQLAVVFGDTYYSTDDGEFEDSRFTYSFDGTTLSLTASAGGNTSIALRASGPTSAVPLDEALFGSWTAVSIEATDPAGVHDPVELVSQGWSMQITLNDDGTYTSISQEAGAGPVTDSGEYISHDGILIIDNGPNLYYEVGDGQITVTDNEGEAAYDFDGDGTKEDAIFVYIFEPVS